MDSEAVSLYKNLPKGINSKDPILGALVADGIGQGGIANEITAVKEFVKYISRTDSYDKLLDAELESLVRLMMGLIKRSSDTDEDYKRLFTALIQRGGSKVFGTKTDILGALRFYLNKDIKIDVIENTDGTNLILNPNFATAQNFWVFDGFAALTTEAAFCNLYGAQLYDVGGNFSQTLLSQESGIYVLHVFMRGKCAVEITDANGKYWNSAAFDWQDDEVLTILENGTIETDFKDKYFFFRQDIDFSFLTVKFIYSDIESHVDHIRVYKKPRNPSYSILLVYPGELVDNTTFSLDKTYHPDGDPNDDDNYDTDGYFDFSPIIGKREASTVDFYIYLLNFMNPAGVQYFFDEVLNQESPSDTIPFVALQADGNISLTTTKLTIILGADILSGQGEITFVAGDTGASITGYTNIGNGRYEVVLSGITQSGLVGITISHSGVTPASKTVSIFYAQTVAFTALSANGWTVDFKRLIADGWDALFESLTANGFDVDFKSLTRGQILQSLTANGWTVDVNSAKANGWTVDFSGLEADGSNEVDFLALAVDVDFQAVQADGFDVDFNDLTADGFTE